MRVPITPEILKALENDRKRTGVGSVQLLKDAKNVPLYLTPKHIESWLSGRVKTAPKEHLDYVLEQWSHLPQWEFLSVTHEHVQEMKAQFKRSKVGPMALLKNIPDKPDGLEYYTIEAWLNGRSRTARKDHLNFVMASWSALPAAYSVKHVASGYAEITAAQRERLLALKDKTGLAPNALMRGAKDAPPGLHSNKIKAWMTGSIKTARPEDLDYVFKRWEALPSKEKDYIFIGEEELDALRGQRDRTGFGSTKLLKQSDDVPQGLRASLVESWLTGRTVRAKREYLEFVLSAYKKLPDLKSS